MKKKIIGIVAAVVLIIPLFFLWGEDEVIETKEISAKVKRGRFEVTITTTGDLQAENSVKIEGPDLRQVRIYNVKITDLVAEGSLIDSGAYVGTLDRSEISTTLQEIENNLEVLRNELTNLQLDTAMEMQNLRDQLQNLKYSLEECQIVVEQSVYEPQATIRKAQMELEKARRALEQGEINYKLKREQAKMKIIQQVSKIEEQENEFQQISSVMDLFIIKAPASGMVIYEKEWGGTKRKVGSTITPWDRTVATLPDFSTMVSQTYINEIDFNRIKTGQKVTIGVDAFPEKRYTGVVKEIANIGEQLEGNDAKVFEVVVKIDVIDSIMRPSMTTSNAIVTAIHEDVIYIPLEAFHQNDSIAFVYKLGKKISKQIVIEGDANDKYIIITKGLTEEDEVLLTIPENEKLIPFTGKELISEIKEIKKKKMEMKNNPQEENKRNKNEQKMEKKRDKNEQNKERKRNKKVPQSQKN